MTAKRVGDTFTGWPTWDVYSDGVWIGNFLVDTEQDAIESALDELGLSED